LAANVSETAAPTLGPDPRMRTMGVAAIVLFLLMGWEVDLEVVAEVELGAGFDDNRF